MSQFTEVTEARRACTHGLRVIHVVLALASVPPLAACTPSTSDTVPAPSAERSSPVEGLPNVVERDGIRVGYLASVSRDAALLVLEEALRARAALQEYIGRSLGPVEIRISDERGIPFASGSTIWLPAGRASALRPDWSHDAMSITHEMTHLFGTGRREDRLLVEGLAVYLNTKVGRPTYPNDGADLDSLMHRLEADLGRRLPLLESEGFRRRGTREERRLAYVQEGSFARWFIENEGFDAYIALMNDDTRYADEMDKWRDLETRWRAAVAP